MNAVRDFAQLFANWNLSPEVLMIGLGSFGIILIVLLVLILKGSGNTSAQAFSGIDVTKGVLGRLEKLETTMNTFKTEILRSQYVLTAQLDAIKQDLGAIRGTSSSSAAVASVSVSPVERASTDGVAASAVQIDVDLDEASKKKIAELALESEVAVSPDISPSEFQKSVLDERLSQSRRGFFDRFKGLFKGKASINKDTLEELEGLLIESDLGVKLATGLVEDLKGDVAEGREISDAVLLGILKSKVLSILEYGSPSDPSIFPVLRVTGPTVVLVVGVNGVGKTTTVAKLAAKWRTEGARVLLVAADTFRAAAVDQLKVWGERIGAPVVSGAEDAKPQTVVFDAMERAKKEEFDVIIIDTAGRLHTKANLLQELSGVKGTIQKHMTDAPHETILVVDGATGQNAVSQAKEFNEATPLTGVIVTKLDGTPKGGVVVAVKNEIGIPVRYIGVGESEEDLKIFNASEFVDALFTPSSNDMVEDSAHGEERRRRRRGPEAAVV